MKRIGPAVVAIVVCAGHCACWATGDQFSHERHMVTEPALRNLFRLVERTDRSAQGFTTLPSEGSVDVARLKMGGAPPAGWEDVTQFLEIREARRGREWYFARTPDGPIFLCEVERVRRPPEGAGQGWASRNRVRGDLVRLQADCGRGAGAHVVRFGVGGTQDILLRDAILLRDRWLEAAVLETAPNERMEQTVGAQARIVAPTAAHSRCSADIT